jgi:predicted metal-dependent hydrolase
MIVAVNRDEDEVLMSNRDEAEPDWPVEIIRSERRKKGVSARLKEGRFVVRAPAGMSDEALAPIIAKLKARLARRVKPVAESDAALEKRAQRLNKQYFEGKLRWQSIRYVNNQQKRYGSCTPANGTIRLSGRVATLPGWVRDYVVMHEISHLVEANHSPRFWELVNRYPLTERARGYLMALDMEAMQGEES